MNLGSDKILSMFKTFSNILIILIMSMARLSCYSFILTIYFLLYFLYINMNRNDNFHIEHYTTLCFVCWFPFVATKPKYAVCGWEKSFNRISSNMRAFVASNLRLVSNRVSAHWRYYVKTKMHFTSNHQVLQCIQCQ